MTVNATPGQDSTGSSEPGGMTRREMLRASLVAAAWSVPTVIAVRSSPAAAGSPAPQARAPGSPAPDGGGGRGGRGVSDGGLLPRTGSSMGWLAIAAAGAMGTGGAALKRARTLRGRASVAGADLDADEHDEGETNGGPGHPSDEATEDAVATDDADGAADDAVAKGNEGGTP